MSEHPPQRIGDADRDQAAECLREHLAQGRLSQDEFDDRLGAALAAKTAADIAPLFTDLPDPRPASLQSVEPATPWPAYSPQAANLPAPAAPARPPAVSNGLQTAMTVVTAVAWPAWLLLSFATSWRYWWLIWIPIIISIAAGAVRRQSDQ